MMEKTIGNKRKPPEIARDVPRVLPAGTERISPERLEDAEVTHRSRYQLAVKYLGENDVVLDCACGVGYGSYLMGGHCKRVVGLDNSEEAIVHAKSKFSSKNVEFYTGDAEEIPEEDNSFDAVISFEAIEHLENPEKFLEEVSRVLKPGGLFIISTPRRPHGSPFHKHEYGYGKFVELLSHYFAIETMLGQAFTDFPVINMDMEPHEVEARFIEHDKFNFIAICKNNQVK